MAFISILIIDFSIGFVGQAYFIDEGSPDPGGLPHRWLLRSFIPVGFAILTMQSVSNLLKTVALIFRRQRRSFIPVGFAILTMQSVSNLLKTVAQIFRWQRITG
jgi:TRAP-type mannitol/chloroaromatic compound transport system permease small subunit